MEQRNHWENAVLIRRIPWVRHGMSCPLRKNSSQSWGNSPLHAVRHSSRAPFQVKHGKKGTGCATSSHVSGASSSLTSASHPWQNRPAVAIVSVPESGFALRTTYHGRSWIFQLTRIARHPALTWAALPRGGSSSLASDPMILNAHHYRDRVEAGQVLARQLAHYASRVDTLVLAVPRGGVPVAVEVAGYLNAPLDSFVIHELVSPGASSETIGVVAAGGVPVFDDAVIHRAGLSPHDVADLTFEGNAELDRRQRFYRGSRPPPQITGRVVILVSDGIATALALHAAVIALHRQLPAWLVVAAPVGSAEACAELAQEVHEVVCPVRPEPFHSIGLSYDHFPPGDDDDVRATLRRSTGLPRA